MKKIVFLLMLLIAAISLHGQNHKISAITIDLISPVKTTQEMLELPQIEVEITNNTDSIVKIKESDRLYFESQIVGNDSWIPFRAGNAVFSTSHYQQLGPYESIRIITCLNLFDVFRQYTYKMKKQLPFDKECLLKIRTCITSTTAPMKFCSSEIFMKINAMSEMDRAAFAYIAKNDQDPYHFTTTSCMEGTFPVHSDIADSLALHYPTSTFKMLADLSIAHEKAGLKEVPEALKPEIRQLLEKPLASPYTYVRYLAETLRKRLQ